VQEHRHAESERGNGGKDPVAIGMVEWVLLLTGQAHTQVKRLSDSGLLIEVKQGEPPVPGRGDPEGPRYRLRAGANNLARQLPGQGNDGVSEAAEHHRPVQDVTALTVEGDVESIRAASRAVSVSLRHRPLVRERPVVALNRSPQIGPIAAGQKEAAVHSHA
jgi:hypothetical protein